jgi:hypothetical protein
MWVSEPHIKAIFGYAPPYNGAPFSHTTTSLRKPFGIAIDSSDNLYIADMVQGTLVLNPPYTGSPMYYLSAGRAVALAGNCDVAIAGGGGAYLYGPYPLFVYISSVGLPGTGGVASAVAFDSSNDLFIGTLGRIQDSVYVYRPPYTGGPAATITIGVKRVQGLTVDANGDLFVSDSGTSAITEYAPPYTGGPTLTLSAGLRTPGGITDLAP